MGNNWILYILLLLGIIILPLSTVYFFRFLAKKLPIPEKCRKYADSLKELKIKYKKWDLLSGLICIIFMFSGFYISWWVCNKLCFWNSSGFSGEFVLFPKKAMCLAPCVPFGIAFSIAGTLMFLKLLFNKESFSEMNCYSNLKMGFNVSRFLYWFFGICAVLAVIGFISSFNCYMIIKKDGLTYNPFIGFRECSYNYSDIEKVIQHTFIKNRFKKDITVRLEFKDGEKWNSGSTEEISNEKANKIVDYISRRAGIKIEKVEKKRRNLK